MIGLTHDVDALSKTPMELLWLYARRPVSLTPRAVVRKMARRDYNWMHIPELCALEAKYGVRSTFFFRVDESRYPLTPYLKRVIRDLDSAGWEIGLHASIESAHSMGVLAQEKERLEDTVGHDVVGVRHHYLAWTRGTWGLQQEVGFKYDSTYGSTVRVIDDQPFRVGQLVVFPLNFMDSAVFNLGFVPLVTVIRMVDQLMDSRGKDNRLITFDFHQDWLSSREERITYEHILRTAKARRIWAGSLGDLLDRLGEVKDLSSR